MIGSSKGAQSRPGPNSSNRDGLIRVRAGNARRYILATADPPHLGRAESSPGSRSPRAMRSSRKDLQHERLKRHPSSASADATVTVSSASMGLLPLPLRTRTQNEPAGQNWFRMFRHC